jgi:hypothetical protein
MACATAQASTAISATRRNPFDVPASPFMPVKTQGSVMGKKSFVHLRASTTRNLLGQPLLDHDLPCESVRTKRTVNEVR